MSKLAGRSRPNATTNTPTSLSLSGPGLLALLGGALLHARARQLVRHEALAGGALLDARALGALRRELLELLRAVLADALALDVAEVAAHRQARRDIADRRPANLLEHRLGPLPVDRLLVQVSAAPRAPAPLAGRALLTAACTWGLGWGS